MWTTLSGDLGAVGVGESLDAVGMRLLEHPHLLTMLPPSLSKALSGTRVRLPPRQGVSTLHLSRSRIHLRAHPPQLLPEPTCLLNRRLV